MATPPRRKILLISSNSSARGGGERYLVYMAMGLRESGCDVHVLLADAPFMDGWATELKAAGATIHRRPLAYLAKRPLRFIQSLVDFRQHRTIAGFCRQLAPDGILVNQQYDEDGLDYIQGALAAGVCKVAGIIHMPMTGTKNQRPLGRQRGRVLRCWYRRYLYWILFSSAGSEREFLDYYHLQLTTTVIPSGTPLATARRDRQADRVALNDPWFAMADNHSAALPIVGAVCQFVPQKNLHLLIDGWLAAAAEGCATRLLLIGDGPQRQEIEQRLASIDSGLWHITGWGEHYIQYMSQLDVFLMPSLFEGLPLSLIEAVGMGLPAIVSDFNGATDVAAKAPWVTIVNSPHADSLGAAIARELNDPHAPVTEADRQQFIAYFSQQRMASDVIRLFQYSEIA